MSNNLFVTPREYFGDLVKQGLVQRRIDTYPIVQAYLVELLEFYMDARNLFQLEDTSGRRRQETLAELFLRANNSEPATRIELLKRLGDTSLYVSGFFGDSLERKVVDIDYYADMGGTAYATLAHCFKQDTKALLYQEISRRFIEFVDVLTFISQKSFVNSDESVLRLYERYLRTGSEMARDRLVEMGVMTIPSEQVRNIKQN
jgi:hypothetical protein